MSLGTSLKNSYAAKGTKNGGSGKYPSAKAGLEDANRPPSASKWGPTTTQKTPREEARATSGGAKNATHRIPAENWEKYAFGSPRRTLRLGKSRQTARDILKNPLPCPDVDLGTPTKPETFQNRCQNHQSHPWDGSKSTKNVIGDRTSTAYFGRGTRVYAT